MTLGNLIILNTGLYINNFHSIICDSENNNDYERHKVDISFVLPFGKKVMNNVNHSKIMLKIILYLLNMKIYLHDDDEYMTNAYDIYIMMIELYHNFDKYTNKNKNNNNFNNNHNLMLNNINYINNDIIVFN